VKAAIKDGVKKLLGIPFGTIVGVATTRPVAALTFDDGPDPAYTPRLLDILARHGAKATFFMLGERASRHPELVARVAREGHEIGNHSWDHPSLASLSREEFDRQIDLARIALRPHGARLMRPPHGYQTLKSFLSARRHGYEVVCWNIDCTDWQIDDGPALARSLDERLASGAIILLHDSLAVFSEKRFIDRRPTLDAVDRLLGARPDFRFLTVSELMQAGAPVRRFWRSLPPRSG
jgi:peptidoglycan/xylan/chitin deacetylase (PgdA/CDA1 family)